MTDCDVLVVGGGPAGSTCAWKLAAAGLKVIIIDKAVFPRDKICAGWITPAIIEELELDIDDYGQGRVFQPINGFRTGAMQGELVHNVYRHPVSYGIRRVEFDDYLLRRSGACLRLGEAVTSLALEQNCWVINKNIRASMLVGAGGHFCPVARHLGAKIGKSERSVMAQEIEFAMTREQQRYCPVDADTPELYFYPDQSGYGWIFRKEGYLNVGLGREGCSQLSHSVLEFSREMQRRGRIPARLEARYKGHTYLLYDHARRRTVADRVILLGDAAGLSYTDSGEGIRPAVESGIIAAELILEAGGSYQQAVLEQYQERLEQRFGERNADRYGFIPEGLRQGLVRQILASRFLSRHILLNRLFLHAHEPVLQSVRPAA